MKLLVHHSEEWLARERRAGVKEEMSIEEADEDDLPVDEQLKVGLKEVPKLLFSALSKPFRSSSMGCKSS